jgi:4'-phosphopantetheinyl transferase
VPETPEDTPAAADARPAPGARAVAGPGAHAATWSTAALRERPVRAPERTEVLLAFVALTGAADARDRALLDAAELARAERFARPADRRRYELAHAGLRLLLGGCLGTDPARVRFDHDADGRPRLAAGDGLLAAAAERLDFNLAHSGDIALVAIARGRAVGADVEQVRAVRHALAVADTHFPPAEADALRALPAAERSAAFLRAWTRKEAVVKCEGTGLGRPLDEFVIDATGAVRPARAGAADPPPAMIVRDLAAPPGHLAAVALGEPGGRTARFIGPGDRPRRAGGGRRATPVDSSSALVTRSGIW